MEGTFQFGVWLVTAVITMAGILSFFMLPVVRRRTNLFDVALSVAYLVVVLACGYIAADVFFNETQPPNDTAYIVVLTIPLLILGLIVAIIGLRFTVDFMDYVSPAEERAQELARIDRLRQRIKERYRWKG